MNFDSNREMDWLKAQVKTARQEIALLKESRAAAVSQEQISRSETNRLRCELAAAQKACAEKHRVLQMWQEIGCDEETQQYLDRALSTDCGKDYVSKEQVKPLVDALKNCVKQCDYQPAYDGLAHAKELGL